MDPVCLDDFEIYAKKHLAKNALDYYRSGSNDEITLGENLSSFRRYSTKLINFYIIAQKQKSNISIYCILSVNSFVIIDSWKIRPRMLHNVSICDMTTAILKRNISFPVCVAPTAMHKMAHPAGEVATAQGRKCSRHL